LFGQEFNFLLSGGGVTPLALVVMMPQMQKLMMIMLQTSLLLKELGIQGRHMIKAHFDQDSFLYF